MLLLVIVALIATSAFYAQAKRRGLQPNRAAVLPFFVLALMMMVAHVAGLLLARLIDVLVVSDFTTRLIWLAFTVFVVCCYLAFISKSWIALVNAPREAEGDGSDE